MPLHRCTVITVNWVIKHGSNPFVAPARQLGRKSAIAQKVTRHLRLYHIEAHLRAHDARITFTVPLPCRRRGQYCAEVS